MRQAGAVWTVAGLVPDTHSSGSTTARSTPPPGPSCSPPTPSRVFMGLLQAGHGWPSPRTPALLGSKHQPRHWAVTWSAAGLAVQPHRQEDRADGHEHDPPGRAGSLLRAAGAAMVSRVAACQAADAQQDPGGPLSGGCPRWCAASTVNTTTPTTEVTNVDARAAGAACDGGCPAAISTGARSERRSRSARLPKPCPLCRTPTRVKATHGEAQAVWPVEACLGGTKSGFGRAWPGSRASGM